MELSKSMKTTSRGDVEVKLNIRFDVRQLSENRTIRVELDLNNIAPHPAGVTATDYASSFRDYALAYTGKDARMVSACASQFEAFCHGTDPVPKELTAEVCQDFYEYLTSRLNGSTPANYFKKFRRYLDTVSGGCAGINPAAGVKLHYDDYRSKEALTIAELRRLSQTPCRAETVSRAFLFSCFTGLRWSDVTRLRYEDIDLEQRSMTIVQSKVSRHSSKARLRTYLNESALRMVGDGTGKVFDLPSYQSAYKIVQKWSAAAGISKHVTFHCARHTFVSRLVACGVDMKTVATLAGHSSTRHTERYAHSEKDHLMECLEMIALK